MKRLPALILLVLLSAGGNSARARIGDTMAASVARYGKPERDALKTSGLLFFRKGDLCYIAHFDHGYCDVLSIFSGHDDMGFPSELIDTRLSALLREEGGSVDWEMAPGFTINGVWNSADGRSFAIYDTMRHKLVIMTRKAYLREKEGREALKKSHEGR